VHGVPCAHAPFCRSTFCLAETILHFCIFNCDSSGLQGSYFQQFWESSRIIPSRRDARKPPKQMHPSALFRWPRDFGQLVLLDWKSILGLDYLRNTGKKGLSKNRQRKVRNATDWQSSPWWSGGSRSCVRANETCLGHRASMESQSSVLQISR
jgi:hypothetical protein